MKVEATKGGMVEMKNGSVERYDSSFPVFENGFTFSASCCVGDFGLLVE